MQSANTPSANFAAHALCDGDREYMIGQSAIMCAIKRDMARIANSASTVLITGETGTGKETGG